MDYDSSSVDPSVGPEGLGYRNPILQGFRYCLHFDLKKYFFLAFLEGGCFISKVYQGHCASLCKVSAETDKYNRNESKNRKTNKVLFEKCFLKVGL